MKKRWVHLGIVGKAHGLNGAFFISRRDEHLPEGIKVLRIGPDPEKASTYQIVSSRWQGERPVVACREITTREAAEQLIAQIVWCEREKLKIDEADEYLWADLVGKEVRDFKDASVGHIREVGNFGASDIVRLVHPTRGVLEIPFVRSYFDMTFKSEDPFLRLLVTLDVFDEAWSPS